ncbi:MAG: hypothetical protein Q7T74_00055 [Candidatus Saccharibacteria bacterium]|nr:hypothetical protein [Candidatus Saccharibacteria bacterium]
MNITNIKQLVRSKYKKHWEWRATSKSGMGAGYQLLIWTGADRNDSLSTIKILANLKGDQWVAAISYLDKVGPSSLPNTNREKAVDEALKLWWESR